MVNVLGDESAELGVRRRSRVSKLECSANSRRFRVLQRNGREGLDIEVGALGAGPDELGSEGEDSARTESNIEGTRDGSSSTERADQSRVPSLNSDNASRRSQDIRARNQGRSTEVGGHTYGFEDAGGGDHGLGGRERGIEVVLAGLDGDGTGAGDGAQKRRHVRCFCLANFLELDDVLLGQAQGHEVGGRELGEALLVEFGFEVLGCQGAGGDVSLSFSFMRFGGGAYNCRMSTSVSPPAGGASPAGGAALGSAAGGASVAEGAGGSWRT